LCSAVIKSRAIDNGAFLVNLSFGQKAGTAWEPGMILGCSGVIGPDGLVLANAGRHVGMALPTIDLDQPRVSNFFTWADPYDFRSDMLADRRPAAYQVLTDESLVPAPRHGLLTISPDPSTIAINSENEPVPPRGALLPGQA